jgi:hypothetical protein
MILIGFRQSLRTKETGYIRWKSPFDSSAWVTESNEQGRIFARAKGARARAQHGIFKKIEIEVWYAGKKGCPRERNLREIDTESTIMFCLLSVFCVVYAYT